MKAQEELLHGTNIPTDDLGINFTKDEADFLAVAEGVISVEWERVTDYLGLAATADSVPEHYEQALRWAGRWDGEHPTKAQLERDS